MATKSLFLAALLVLAVGLAPHVAAADTQLPLGIISGIVPCSAGSSINVAAVPVFPNAAVQVVCGSTVVGAAKADDSGAFSVNLGPVSTSLLNTMVGNQCKVEVVTPLASARWPLPCSSWVSAVAAVSGALAG
uniref:Uncharacterized protein n=1 Tax=Avena sativa TaxID=4498 RepID=A0ACD5XPZ6_AVESA